MTHFSLDVDPRGLDADAMRIAAYEASMLEEALRIERRLVDVPGVWTGAAAQALTREAEALVAQLRLAAPMFSSAATALRSLGAAAEEAVVFDLPGLNGRWDAADAAYTAGVGLRTDQEHAAAAADAARSALPGTIPIVVPPVTAPSVEECAADLARTRSRLELEFDQLRTQLRQVALRSGEAAAQSTVAPVNPTLAAMYAVGGYSTAVATWVTYDPSVSSWETAFPLTALHDALTGGTLPLDSAALKRLLDTARAVDMTPLQYRQLLKTYWEARALEAAGIDGDTWDPASGVTGNKDTILAVYNYYRSLFQAHPELEWAGMANMVGPGFAAGFFDLSDMRRLARELGNIPSYLLPPGLGGPVHELGTASDQDLAWYESQFLTMQKAIFLDMGSAHQAYIEGGLPALQEMYSAGLIDARTFAAWQNIASGAASGDSTQLDQGAQQLAYREQFTIIGNDWDQMEQHPPFGAAFTYLMTVVGKPSIPGARPPGDVFPYTVEIPGVSIPYAFHVHEEIVTPFPDFDVADRNSRWKYFTADTLPAYLTLLHLHPDQMRSIMDMPLATRIDQQRLSARIDAILAELATHWSVKVKG